jgi:putative phosphoribosyl transferase
VTGPGRFGDRTDAGLRLARRLAGYAGRDGLLVLGLPRGGVPVAFEVACALGADLDVLVVRKLGVPGQEELAMGAIASGGARVLNQRVLALLDVGEQAVAAVAESEGQELERREQAYRGSRPAAAVQGRPVILVDDGLATGSTMQVAVAAVRTLSPSELVVAVPVAPPDTVTDLRRAVDRVICLLQPEPFVSVGQWYDDFEPVPDELVRELLDRAWDGAG